MISLPPTPASPAGLRERKKVRTRRAIQRAAFRLFAEHGFEATRVDEIAEAAEVSASTVFRYFPTKEDIALSVFGEEGGPVLAAALRARPAAEPPLTALREALREIAVGLSASAADAAEARARLRLIAAVPAVRGRLLEELTAPDQGVCRALAERAGHRAADLETKVLAGGVLGAVLQALWHWAESGGREDLGGLADRTVDILERHLAARPPD